MLKADDELDVFILRSGVTENKGFAYGFYLPLLLDFKDRVCGHR